MSQIQHLNQLQRFFVPFDLERLDPESRIVRGYCYTTGRVKGDKWDLTAEALKESADEYMKMPCIRAMHGRVAAGKGLSVEFDDLNRGILEAKIVDDNEWEKVKEGVYRGFSIGGQPELVCGTEIRKFRWLETSLVDRPADPDALFTVVRAEGALDAEYDVQILEEGEEYVVENLARGLTSDDVPNRENLEGGKTEPAKRQAQLKDNIETLRQSLLDANDGSDTEPLINRAVKAAVDALKGAELSVDIRRGTGNDISPAEICDHLLSLYNSNNDDEPGIQSAIDAANAALKGDVERAEAQVAGAQIATNSEHQEDQLGEVVQGEVGRADGPLREAYGWFPEQVASFKNRTGAALNEAMGETFARALYRFMDTLMEAPDLAARHQNVSDFAQFLNVWLDHDAAMREELARGEGLADSEAPLPFTALVENLRVALTRGEEAESFAANVPLERFEALQSELSTVQAEAQATLSRVEAAEGNVSRLEGEVVQRDEQITLMRAEITARDTQIADLRATPTKVTPAVQYPEAAQPHALVRSHPANDATEDSQDPELIALIARRDEAQQAAHAETDVVKRADLVTKWMSLDGQVRTALSAR